MRHEPGFKVVNEAGDYIEDTRENRRDLWERYLPKVDPKDRRGITFAYRYNEINRYWTTVVQFRYTRKPYYERKRKIR